MIPPRHSSLTVVRAAACSSVTPCTVPSSSWRCLRSTSSVSWRSRSEVVFVMRPSSTPKVDTEWVLLAMRPHEHGLESVVVLDDAAGAQYDALERGVDEVDRDLGLLGDPKIE